MTTKASLFLCLCALLAACGGNNERQSTSPVRVKVAQVEAWNGSSSREFTFISQPFKTSELSFRVGGPIDRFEVYAGSYYRKGEIIAQVDSRDFRIRKERAEAIYTQSKAEYERIEVLYEINNLAASTYEKARADYTSAKTAFESATNELNDTRLIAPFNGYVAEVYIEKYQEVKATQPVLSFIDIDQLKIETYVTQEVAFGTQKPTELTLCFDAAPTKSYTARVEEISKSTTRNNISYLLTALLPNSDGALLGGMSGKVRFEVPSGARVLTLPQSALCNRPTEGTYVWVVDTTTNKVSQRPVEVGELLPQNKVTLTAGVTENETVAVSGLRFLSDGITIIQ